MFLYFFLLLFAVTFPCERLRAENKSAGTLGVFSAWLRFLNYPQIYQVSVFNTRIVQDALTFDVHDSVMTRESFNYQEICLLRDHFIFPDAIFPSYIGNVLLNIIYRSVIGFIV